ncbi:hypothetical protein ABIC06_008764, partial [Bradyrhizobium sp. RT7b]
LSQSCAIRGSTHPANGQTSSLTPSAPRGPLQIKVKYCPCVGVKGFAEGLTPAIRFSCLCAPRTRRHAMNVRYRVDLSQIERTELRALLSGGKHASRKLKRAQILLAADAGAGDEEIAKSVGVGGSTVYRIKRRFVEGNLERALSDEPSRGGTQTHGQGRSPAGSDRLRQSPGRPRPLHARAAGRRDGQADRTQEPVARDRSGAPG